MCSVDWYTIPHRRRRTGSGEDPRGAPTHDRPLPEERPLVRDRPPPLLGTTLGPQKGEELVEDPSRLQTKSHTPGRLVRTTKVFLGPIPTTQVPPRTREDVFVARGISSSGVGKIMVSGQNTFFLKRWARHH